MITKATITFKKTWSYYNTIFHIFYFIVEEGISFSLKTNKDLGNVEDEIELNLSNFNIFKTGKYWYSLEEKTELSEFLKITAVEEYLEKNSTQKIKEKFKKKEKVVINENDGLPF